MMRSASLLSPTLVALALFCASAASAQDPERAPDAAPETTLRAVSRVEVAVGFGVFTRRFRYNDDVYGFLRDYTLPAGPELTLHLRAYPGAFFRRGIGDVFGLDLRFDRSMGIESERSNGVRFPTIQRILEANVVARLPLGGHEVIGLVGYGHHAFELNRTEPSAPDVNNVPDVPSVGYGYVRLGVESRLVVHPRVGFLLGASYLVVRRMGGIEDDVWFPRASAGGMTATGRVIVAVVRGFELRVGVEYRRYFLDMHARPGDANIAGGALDAYVRTELTAAYRF